MYDLVVVGGGLGGLALAGLTQYRGLRVALLEAHTRLGGCAGYFPRGPYTFDAGATALMGLGEQEPVGALLQTLGVEFAGVRTPSYRVCLPDRVLEVVADAQVWEARSAEAFPERSGAIRRFWRWQEAVGNTLFRVAGRVPRLPLGSVSDLAHDLKALGPSGALAAATSLLTVQDVLSLLGLAHDRPFRALVAMLLQDTAQAGPETVPFANAAVCLQAYRLGMCRPLGGMRALVEGIGQRFSALGGDLRVGTLVDRIEPNANEEGGFTVVTRRRQRLQARQVALNLPLDRAAALLGRGLEGRLARAERQSRATWSACTAYLACRREAIADAAPLFHQVLQDYDRPIHDGNNVLISLSPPGDPGYGPEDVRVLTLSTHTRPADWHGLDADQYRARKQQAGDRLLSALRRALPDVPDALVHAEFATPRSFARYTRRTLGAVGGAPVSRSNSNFLAVGSDLLGPDLWVVGDSVFPGQGTLAVVLSALRLTERIVAAPGNTLARLEPVAS